ncbi:S39AB protein, partial [Copsychus sechellarum]|nr:S39AB protein [Copsychus sechellarum]
GPVLQAVLGTLLTWGLTAAGSALVFVFSSGQRRILDGSLGFAAGVMLAASYWSLLAPAIELAEQSGTFGAFSFCPVAAGFVLGAAFVCGADLLLPVLGFSGPSHAALAPSCEQRAAREKQEQEPGRDWGIPWLQNELSIRIGRAGLQPGKHPRGKEEKKKTQQKKNPAQTAAPVFPAGMVFPLRPPSLSPGIMFVIVMACPAQGNPEPLPLPLPSSWIFCAFCRNLAIGIGIQNFPEGLAVSLPLRGAGFSTWKAFW